MTASRQPSLVWGVKQSFRSYVEAVGGVIEAQGGAERATDGAFVFAPAPDSGFSLDADGRPQGRGAFLGEVRFEGHGGMLSVFLADPAVEIGPAGAVLTVADSAARTRRLEIARLDLAAATTGEAGDLVIPTALTADGAQLLGDHYPPMTPVDPVRLVPAAS